MGCRLLAALLLLAALSAQAETYKWVDAKGVVNYSNAPPPAAKAMKVEDRLSTYEPDPALKNAAAAGNARDDYRQMSADAEWLQRQRLMALKDSYAAYPSPNTDEFYPAYYSGYPVFPVARARTHRTSFATAPSLRTAPAPRGALVRLR